MGRHGRVGVSAGRSVGREGLWGWWAADGRPTNLAHRVNCPPDTLTRPHRLKPTPLLVCFAQIAEIADYLKYAGDVYYRERGTRNPFLGNTEGDHEAEVTGSSSSTGEVQGKSSSKGNGEGKSTSKGMGESKSSSRGKGEGKSFDGTIGKGKSFVWRGGVAHQAAPAWPSPYSRPGGYIDLRRGLEDRESRGNAMLNNGS